jgi:hypothetical protein
MSEIFLENEYNPEELIDEQNTLWLDHQFVKHVRFVLEQSDGKKLRDRNPMILPRGQI